ncbi:HNH endonuclease signature motif containing protein [Mycetocola spongiae]|uniref:HNH endonuclease signature motif containing protein n=1 Tax=Mycetocola spongiae TaxID=2859226 RepID=UPI001CF124D6|nr:HNH endonuclease [Mycetocola spongiae]UCR89274.1 HNH endonuclease [Mycetocola spongiae]
MIRQRIPKLTAAQEAAAYRIVTDRDPACVRCGAGGITRDHRQNRQRGNTRPSNLQGLCGTGTTGCHGWKTISSAAATNTGFAVPRWANPAEWPAQRLDHGRPIWVLYDDLGGWEEITAAEAKRRIEGG